MHHPHADCDLARRLERTEGLACAAIVQSRAKLQPQSKSCWHDFGGSCAMFDGPGSPMTQAFGHGLFDDPQGHELDAIEAFFRGHSTKAVLEISPLAGLATTDALQMRHYRIVEMSSVLCRPSRWRRATGTAHGCSPARARDPRRGNRNLGRSRSARLGQ